jgi:hypothetical protein
MSAGSQCQYCGTSVEADSAYCRRCGRKFNEKGELSETDLLAKTGRFAENVVDAYQASVEYVRRFPESPAVGEVALSAELIKCAVKALRAVNAPLAERLDPDGYAATAVLGELVLAVNPPIVLANGVITSARIVDPEKRDAVSTLTASFEDANATLLTPLFSEAKQEADGLMSNGESLAQKRGLTREQAYADAGVFYRAFQEGDLEGSRRGFEHLKQMNPFDGYFRNILGATLSRQGLPQAALREYLFGFSVDPASVHLAQNLIRELIQHSLYVSALDVAAHFRKARRIASVDAAEQEIVALAGLSTVVVAVTVCSFSRVSAGDVRLDAEDLLATRELPSRPWLTNLSAGNANAHPLSSKRIFISYRRADSTEMANRLSQALKVAVPSLSVFVDESAMVGAFDFRPQIRSALADSAAHILLIGPSWRTPEGLKRFQQRDDVLRREIEFALARGTTMVPILIEDARMPEASTLPEVMRRITGVHACRLRNGEFAEDVGRILTVLVAATAVNKRRSEEFMKKLDEIEELEKTDPEAADRSLDTLMGSWIRGIGLIMTTKAAPGAGVPHDEIAIQGVWECNAVATSGDRLFLYIALETDRLFTGQLQRHDKRGRSTEKRELRGEWAQVVDRDQNRVLGLHISSVAIGAGPFELTIPFDKRVSDVMVGRDAEGTQYSSRNLAPRPSGF